MLTHKELQQIRSLVITSLYEDYGINEVQASKMINNSTFNSMTKVNSELLCHYSPEYWADKIVKEYRRFQPLVTV